MDRNNYNDIKEQISDILVTLNRKTALKLLGEILEVDYDLPTAGNIVKADCDSSLNKRMFEDIYYSEGNEEAGFIRLKEILDAVEEIVNLDDYVSDNVHFEYFVRPETEEETKENNHPSGIEWWTKDESIDINKAYIQFDGA